MTPTLSLFDAFAAVAVIDAADRVGLLALLLERPTTAAEAADRLDTDGEVTEMTLEALAALDLASRDAAGYRATPTLEAAGLFRFWDGLETSLRGGGPAVRCDRREDAGPTYAAAVGLMSASVAQAAADAAALLLDRLEPGPAVLEVGAGAASWSLAVSRADADCRVTALDLPEVAARTREHVSAAGRAGAYEIVGADMFTHDYPPAAYDLVLVPNVCHLFGAQRVVALLSRLRASLRPGGLMAVIDILPGDQPGAVEPLYALSLRLRTESGGIHALADYRRWLTGVGLESIDREPLRAGFGFSLICARAPE